MQRFPTNSSLLRYGFALLNSGVALAVGHVLNPIAGHSAASFAVTTATVMLSAWLVDAGPAPAAAIAGLAAVDWAFLTHANGFQGYIKVVHVATWLVVGGS